MASPNVLAGIAAGGGFLQGLEQGQQRAERNELAQFNREDRARQSQLLKAFPAAVSGDQNALALVAQSDPQTFMGLQTHHAKLAEAKKQEQQQRAQQFAGAGLYALDQVRKAPAEQQQALYHQSVQQLQQLDPEMFEQFGGAPPQYDPAFVQAVAPRLMAIALGPEGMAKYATERDKGAKFNNPIAGVNSKTGKPEFRQFNDAGESQPVTDFIPAPSEESKPKPSDIAGMRKEFTGLTKDFQVVQDSYNRIQEVTKKPSAAGDLALLYNYVKLLDPGSVVRESEFALAATAGSYGERIKAEAARVMAGERLSEAMRADYKGRADDLFTAQKNSYNQIKSEYGRLAKARGIDPGEVTPDLETPQAPKTDGGEQIKEGATATNPETGEQLVYRGGKWVKP